MRVVVDTNVLISGLISRKGPPAAIVDLISDAKLSVIIDDRIEAEYREVLSRPGWPFPWEEGMALLDEVLNNGEKVVADPLKADVPDPDDLMFIEVAVEAQADCIVTGNKRHFPKAAAKNISVLSPSEFMQMIREINR